MSDMFHVSGVSCCVPYVPYVLFVRYTPYVPYVAYVRFGHYVRFALVCGPCTCMYLAGRGCPDIGAVPGSVPVCTRAGKSARIWGACTGVCCVDALCPLFTFLCQAGRPYVRLCPFRTVMYLAGRGACPILAFLCLDAWRVPVCTGAGKLDLEGATGGRGARSCSLCS